MTTQEREEYRFNLATSASLGQLQRMLLSYPLTDEQRGMVEDELERREKVRVDR